MIKITKMLVLGLLLACSFPSLADDKSDLNQLLNDFLDNKVGDDFKNHNRFWADDLVYTSSAGKRFDKSVIIDGIKEEKKVGKRPDSSDNPDPKYWAEETDIRLYGTTAIVAFKLGAEWQEEGTTKTQFYYNTGTFLKRDGVWQVIAWQATKIPQ
ncbi:nuclear transport factor 2 family protein [Paraneptunicella aestuarii]|uniref:nuclear transport factor 2 family protein n=1 Tax=Paraneptunicella aestuarii TaxID=2831148 RepID=UPI001E5B0843|nr:nuclear transport factor 2 family protein [Paraneptunicella aestuarii]UAA40109.1 nuclear transport factor 2 family protein [Paraneptunicella aestuarii]